MRALEVSLEGELQIPFRIYWLASNARWEQDGTKVKSDDRKFFSSIQESWEYVTWTKVAHVYINLPTEERQAWWQKPRFSLNHLRKFISKLQRILCPVGFCSTVPIICQHAAWKRLFKWKSRRQKACQLTSTVHWAFTDLSIRKLLNWPISSFSHSLTCKSGCCWHLASVSTLTEYESRLVC